MRVSTVVARACVWTMVLVQEFHDFASCVRTSLQRLSPTHLTCAIMRQRGEVCYGRLTVHEAIQ